MLSFALLGISFLFAATRSVIASNVVIKGEHSWNRYAQIEAREVSILWDQAMPPMPLETASFTNASKQGLWSSSLDGPGENTFQTLVALELPQASGHYTVQDHGHIIAAKKGAPFECNYLNLPLLIVSDGPQFKGIVAANKSTSGTLGLGDTAGVFKMEDFLISGWIESTKPAMVNRMDVEPCGTHSCAIYSVHELVTAQQVRAMNLEGFNDNKGLDTLQPHWIRYAQSRPFMYVLERICADESHIQERKSAGARSPIGQLRFVLAVVVALVLASN